MKNPQEFVAVSVAAKELALSTATIQKLVESGKLSAWKTNGGHRRIFKPSIDEYKSKYKILHRHSTAGNELIKILIVTPNLKFITDFIENISKENKKIKCFLFKSITEALIQIKTIDPNIFIFDASFSNINELQLAEDTSKINYFKKILFIIPSELPTDELELNEISNSNTINLENPISHDWLTGFFNCLIINKTFKRGINSSILLKNNPSL